ncbi:reverse transcriptase domain-containing protein [Tanacetum coccineum]|uniref:Reverse transcriptase domain-containing protein n=1 Tax=Tanacetum coccineum TaxID=301880 RepID=A0ABQ5ASR0_9ASTR
MQWLSSKLAALNRFLSKAAKRVLSCLDTLRKCTNKKDFYWTTEAEETFQAMKKLIAELSTLTAPKKEEELMVYLSAANEAISAVLLVEREGREALIHYVSRTLQGAEINYLPMEKLALALVHAARRLRRYFQGHAIKVIIDKPINQILNNREAMGRLAKWGIELEAYDIKYAPRSAIKGQALADFLADTMAEDSPAQVKTKEPNKILVEGESMEEQEVMETKAHIQSGLKEDYGSCIPTEHPTNTDQEQISHIPREENRKADALSKLAAVQCDGLTKGVLIEELNERSKIIPEDATEARTIREKARNYTIEEGEVIPGTIAPMHRRAVHKAMNARYFWPSMHRDANNEISSCDSCQVYDTILKLPKYDMISVTSAWPFRKWGMDIVGPLP